MSRVTHDSRRSAAMAAAILLAACATSSPPATGSATAGPSDVPLPTPIVGFQAPERVADVHPARGRPPQPDLAPRFRAALVDDPCTDRDLATPFASDPIFTLLDRSYALAPTYAPTDLVPASGAGLTGTSGTKLVRAAMLDDLAAMRTAWETAGLTLVVESGYRSYGAQAATFDSWAARLGVAEALRRSARPGHSEHQLGTALDLTSPGWAGRVGDWAVESTEGAWMAAHGWEYGFVMSYPFGSEASTCFGYEPWHYRWIGREAAAEHRASGQSLRDFLADRMPDG